MNLDSAWDAHWHGSPNGHTLRTRYPDRWVRFHSLPHGKRYAETVDETAEVRRRHEVALAELRTPGAPLLVIAEDYAPGDGYAGWVARAIPEARLWRRSPPTAEEPESTFWVLEGIQDLEDIDALLALVAEGGAGSVIISDETLEWLYHPYDGGGDVIARSTDERDGLRPLHPDWLSPRADGL